MKVGSLFAGIGGFDLGLERAGFEIAWQVEIDPWCQRILAKHWPGITRYSDIRTVDWSTVEPVDLLCGGFPCQDISLAGKGAGLAGERSGLWFEYAKAIAALRPRYVLIENVAALRARGLDQVLGELAALGYDAEWHCIPACAFGAPHRRDRVWVVAYTDCESINILHHAGSMEGSQEVAPTWKMDHCNRDSGRSWPFRWTPEPELGRVAHGITHRVDRLRGLGNAVVPQIVQWLGEMIMRIERENLHRMQ